MGDFEIPASKSYLNRALILAALNPRKVTIEGVSACDDVIDMMNALGELGVDIKVDARKTIVFNSLQGGLESRVIRVGEGGTTIRFLIALCALYHEEVEIQCHPRFLQRPLIEYQYALETLGVRVDVRDHSIFVTGPYKKKMVEVNCQRSTQFYSALKLVESKGGFKISAKNLISSQTYIKLTHKLIEFADEEHIPIMADMSSASFLLCYGAIFGHVKIRNVERDSYQADAKVFAILESLGCCLTVEEGWLEVIPPKTFRPLEFDMSDCLDLVPALSFTLALSNQKHKLTGLENLIHKESDRLNGVKDLLSKFGILVKVLGGVMTIDGVKNSELARVKEVNPFADHRLVMLAALLIKASGGGVVMNSETIAKSFPEFVKFVR